MPLHDETEEWWSRGVRKPALIYAITIQEQPADNRHPYSYAEVKWNPIEMLDFRRFKEGVVSYGMGRLMLSRC